MSLACGTAFQCLSGRLGLVTGKDLAAHCGERWPRGAAWFLWVMLELAIVAVDIQVGAVRIACDTVQVLFWGPRSLMQAS